MFNQILRYALQIFNPINAIRQTANTTPSTTNSSKTSKHEEGRYIILSRTNKFVPLERNDEYQTILTTFLQIDGKREQNLLNISRHMKIKYLGN